MRHTPPELAYWFWYRKSIYEHIQYLSFVDLHFKSFRFAPSWTIFVEEMLYFALFCKSLLLFASLLLPPALKKRAAGTVGDGRSQWGQQRMISNLRLLLHTPWGVQGQTIQRLPFYTIWALASPHSALHGTSPQARHALQCSLVSWATSHVVHERYRILEPVSSLCISSTMFGFGSFCLVHLCELAWTLDMAGSFFGC
jgi:hypothetical protein